MKNILVILILSLFLQQVYPDLTPNLKAHFPLGQDTDTSGNSRTLTHSPIRLTPTEDEQNSPNSAYRTTSQGQYLETDISYIVGQLHFTISFWTKPSDLEQLSPYNTLLSILFTDQGSDQEFELINLTVEHITGDSITYREINNYLIQTSQQQWEYVAFIRNFGEFYLYTSSRGYRKVNLKSTQQYYMDQSPLNKIRLGNTFDTQYKQSQEEYQYLGSFSDLRIYNNFSIKEQLYGTAFPEYQHYLLNQIQVAHYPLNKNLKEAGSSKPRLNFQNNDSGEEWIGARSTYDRYGYRNSAVALKNKGSLQLPKEVLDGLSSFTITFYVNGLDIEDNSLDNYASLLNFYDETNEQLFFSFSNYQYKIDNNSQKYENNLEVLDGKWNFIVFSVDGANQVAKFCVNDQCISIILTTTDFLQKTTLISIAKLPSVGSDQNPGFLYIDDLRIFNTLLVDYQKVDVLSLYSANDEESRFIHESGVFRLQGNQYSDLQIKRVQGSKYPVLHNNALYENVDYNNGKKILAAHGPEINLAFTPKSEEAYSFQIQFSLRSKDYGQITGNSKLFRLQFESTTFIDLNFDHFNIHGSIHQIEPYHIVYNNDWRTLRIKFDVQAQTISLYSYQNNKKTLVSNIIIPSGLKKIIAYGEEFYFTNIIYYDYIPHEVVSGDALVNFNQNPDDQQQLEEDTGLVDLPTTPINPPTGSRNPSSEPTDPPTDPVEPPLDQDQICYGLLNNIDASKIKVDFKLEFKNSDYFHTYTITYGDFVNDADCFQTKVLIGSKEATYIYKDDSTYIEFLHSDSEVQGCEKPTDTNTQCKFLIEVSFKGDAQAHRHFTSVVNTPDLNDISNDLSYGVQIDAYVEDEDTVIDQTLDTHLKICADPDCSSYSNSLDLPKGQVSYLEFKILIPGYDQYYPTHNYLKMNGIEVPLENQVQIDSWDQKGRIVYQFIPQMSGQGIKLAVKITLTKTNPQAGGLRRRILEEELVEQRDNIGNHVIISVKDTEEQNLQDQKLQGKAGEKEDDGKLVLYLIIGGAAVLSIVSVSVAVVCYKWKTSKKLRKEQRYRESPSNNNQSSVNDQSLGLGQSSNSINQSRQELA